METNASIAAASIVKQMRQSLDDFNRQKTAIGDKVNRLTKEITQGSYTLDYTATKERMELIKNHTQTLTRIDKEIKKITQILTAHDLDFVEQV